MTARRKAVLPLLAFLIAFASPMLAQGTYTTIDYPGAGSTFCQSINNAGDVVGYYNGPGQHGFLLSGGVYTALDVPGDVQTFAYGINDVGQIVGTSKANRPERTESFLYDIATKTYTTFNYSEGAETTALAINNAGTITGYIIYPSPGTPVGFELNGANYKIVHVPARAGTSIPSINNVGEALLQDFSPNAFFLLTDEGTEKIADGPSGFWMSGINDSGEIAGGYINATNPDDWVSVGFVQPRTGPRQILRAPGSKRTFAFGINNSGTVVGYYFKPRPKIAFHCFIWTPDTAPAK